MGGSSVLVLGAGFTRAFFPEMPLLLDSRLIEPLKELTSLLPAASKVLQAELRMTGGQAINVERLMTRLDSGVPYDQAGREHAELQVLLAELKLKFVAQIDSAKGPTHPDLVKLAEVIVSNRLNCITFNYDDVLDEYLFRAKETLSGLSFADYWQPDCGYGFPVADVHEVLGGRGYEHPPFLLLKLHGSINWRVRKGFVAPYPLDALSLHQNWTRDFDRDSSDYESVLERDPLIVAPVLLKQELRTQPVFKVLWSQATASLADASKVVFIGYSMPTTDLAARALFSESVRHDAQITVVTRGGEDAKQRMTMDAFKSVWPNLTDENFQFRDAVDWARDFCRENA